MVCQNLRNVPCLLLALVLTVLLAPAAASADQSPFDALVERLCTEGFDRTWLSQLYVESNLALDLQGVSLFFRHREAKLNYGQFTSWLNIYRARRYMEAHRTALEQAEKNFGVDPRVITAIILVETKLGTYLGSRSIFTTLSTMATLSDEQPRELLWAQLPEDQRPTHQQYEKKAGEKAAWAFAELKAFLKFAQREQVDPLEIKGSYAGALGISQFMPSNVLAYGTDGNGDGKIDLFVHDDAILSIANFLKRYGWSAGISRERAYRVLLHYNYSKYYVNTVLDIAELLKG